MVKSCRRRYSRVSSANLAEIYMLDKEEVADCGIGKTLNISEGGILLETHFPIETDQLLNLTLALGDDIFEIKGRVIHSQKKDNGKYQNGVQFTEYDKLPSPLLKLFIAKSGGNGNMQNIPMRKG